MRYIIYLQKNAVYNLFTEEKMEKIGKNS